MSESAIDHARRRAPVIEVRDAFCLLEVAGGAVAALRGLNLVVEAGEKVVVHGPNGSGKTTLLRVLIGEQRLASGDAVVAGWAMGRDARGLARWRAANVGWVDQQPGRTLRPEFTVLDNVALQLRLIGADRRASRRRAAEALERMDAGALAARRVHDLSGGEAQQVAVAAALVHRPAVVLADEPAGQLDADAAERVYVALAQATSDIGASLVLVSHDHRATGVADRVLRIRDGRTSEMWQPSASGEELLVVDPLGWVRLSGAARRALGGHGLVHLRVDGDAAVLRGAGDANDPHASFRPPLPEPAVDERPGEHHVAEHTERSERPASDRPVVGALDAVRRRFGERDVLAGIGAELRAGIVCVVKGRSGSGKSTLLRLLVGLDRPDGGNVTILGRDVSGAGREELALLRRDHVGMVLQEVHLGETATLLENLDLARSVRGLPPAPASDRDLLERLGVVALANRQARFCSGGERQRAAIARAMVGSPSLVVLDEPTSQLDEVSTERVLTAVRAMAAAGAAVVVASHDPLVVAAADEVLDLDAPRP